MRRPIVSLSSLSTRLEERGQLPAGHSTVAEEKKKFLDAHDDGKFGRISGRAGGLR